MPGYWLWQIQIWSQSEHKDPDVKPQLFFPSKIPGNPLDALLPDDNSPVTTRPTLVDEFPTFHRPATPRADVST
ncbi:MAG: hypothetical protein HY675_16020 [Chloroflexi bacterium]|nr:hypothetical protein [Chloroflexota bacterium]